MWIINYHLYFPKRGYASSGHRHDWQYVSVYFNAYRQDRLFHRTGATLSGGPYNNTGYAYRMFYTFNGEDIDAEDPYGGLENDHPRIWIGTEHHEPFEAKYNGCDEPECGPYGWHRSDEWRFWPPRDDEHMVFANPGSVEGERLAAFKWGEAEWSPKWKYERLCSEIGMTPRD
jgi:hypothetical protein